MDRTGQRDWQQPLNSIRSSKFLDQRKELQKRLEEETNSIRQEMKQKITALREEMVMRDQEQKKIFYNLLLMVREKRQRAIMILQRMNSFVEQPHRKTTEEILATLEDRKMAKRAFPVQSRPVIGQDIDIATEKSLQRGQPALLERSRGRMGAEETWKRYSTKENKNHREEELLKEMKRLTGENEKLRKTMRRERDGRLRVEECLRKERERKRSLEKEEKARGGAGVSRGGGVKHARPQKTDLREHGIGKTTGLEKQPHKDVEKSGKDFHEDSPEDEEVSHALKTNTETEGETEELPMEKTLEENSSEETDCTENLSVERTRSVEEDKNSEGEQESEDTDLDTPWDTETEEEERIRLEKKTVRQKREKRQRKQEERDRKEQDRKKDRDKKMREEVEEKGKKLEEEKMRQKEQLKALEQKKEEQRKEEERKRKEAERLKTLRKEKGERKKAEVESEMWNDEVEVFQAETSEDEEDLCWEVRRTKEDIKKDLHAKSMKAEWERRRTRPIEGRRNREEEEKERMRKEKEDKERSWMEKRRTPGANSRREESGEQNRHVVKKLWKEHLQRLGASKTSSSEESSS